MDRRGNHRGVYHTDESRAGGEEGNDGSTDPALATNTIRLVNEEATRDRVSECVHDPDREVIAVPGEFSEFVATFSREVRTDR